MSSERTPAAARRRRLLVVDRDPRVGGAVARWFEGSAADVRVAPDATSAEATFASFDPDVVLVEVDLDGGGAALLARLTERSPGFFGLLVSSGHDRTGDPGLGGFPVLTKPWDMSELAAVLAASADRWRNADPEAATIPMRVIHDTDRWH